MDFDRKVQFAREHKWQDIFEAISKMTKGHLPTTKKKVARHLNMTERRLVIDLAFMRALGLIVPVGHQPKKYRYYMSPLGKRVFDEIKKNPDI